VIERTENGEQVYKMINTPPRRGKSEIFSQKGPAWGIGRNPHWQIILVSYGQNLANKFSRRTRDTVASERFSLIFPEIELSTTAAAVQEWEYSSEDVDNPENPMIGTFRAAGAGGGITGMGAHLLISDDIIKNAEEAESETVRNSRYDGYISDIRTRKMPGGSEIYIATRWNEDDPGGRLIKEEGTVEEGGIWELVKIPLFCNDLETDPLGRDMDDHLDDGRFSKEEQLALRRQMMTSPRKKYFFSALYQQDPTPMGDLPFPSIERNQMRIEDLLKLQYTPYICFDIAETEGLGGDTTACIVGGINAASHRPVVYAEEIREKPKKRNVRMLEIWRRVYAATGLEEIYVEGDEDVMLTVRNTFKEHGEEQVSVHKLAHKGRNKAMRIMELDNYYRHRTDNGDIVGTMDVGPEAEIFATRLTTWSRARGGNDDLEDDGAYFCEVAVYVEPDISEWSGRPADEWGSKIWDAKHNVKKEIGVG